MNWSILFTFALLSTIALASDEFHISCSIEKDGESGVATFTHRPSAQYWTEVNYSIDKFSKSLSPIFRKAVLLDEYQALHSFSLQARPENANCSAQISKWGGEFSCHLRRSYLDYEAYDLITSKVRSYGGPMMIIENISGKIEPEHPDIFRVKYSLDSRAKTLEFEERFLISKCTFQ